VGAAAPAADQVVVVVTDPALEQRGMAGWPDAAHKP
jgi:hypothetical protein